MERQSSESTSRSREPGFGKQRSSSEDSGKQVSRRGVERQVDPQTWPSSGNLSSQCADDESVRYWQRRGGGERFVEELGSSIDDHEGNSQYPFYPAARRGSQVMPPGSPSRGPQRISARRMSQARRHSLSDTNVPAINAEIFRHIDHLNKTKSSIGARNPEDFGAWNKADLRGSAESALMESTKFPALAGNATRRCMRKAVPVFRRILKNKYFAVLMGLLITIHAVNLGLRQEVWMKNGDDTYSQFIDDVLLGIFVVELVLRYITHRKRLFDENFIFCDFFVTLCGVATDWILARFVKGSWLDAVHLLMAARLLRLGRLARTFEVVLGHRDLHVLVRGILNSAWTFFVTIVLLGATVFVFSIVAFQVFSTHSLSSKENLSKEAELVDEHFGSFALTMLTMIRFVVMDSAFLVYDPLVKSDSKLIILFAGVLVMPIVILNVVNAAIVENALESALQDKEAAKMQEMQRKQKMVKKLRRIFMRLDSDMSGDLSSSEFMDISPEDMEVLVECTSFTNPSDLFEALDIDGSGCVALEEFIEGLWKAVTTKVPPEMQRMEKQVDSIFVMMKAVLPDLADIRDNQIKLRELMEQIREPAVQQSHYASAASRHWLSGHSGSFGSSNFKSMCRIPTQGSISEDVRLHRWTSARRTHTLEKFELDSPTELTTHNEATGAAKEPPVQEVARVDLGTGPAGCNVSNNGSGVAAAAPNSKRSPPKAVESMSPTRLKQAAGWPAGAGGDVELLPPPPTLSPTAAQLKVAAAVSGAHQEDVMVDVVAQLEKLEVIARATSQQIMASFAVGQPDSKRASDSTLASKGGTGSLQDMTLIQKRSDRLTPPRHSGPSPQNKQHRQQTTSPQFPLITRQATAVLQAAVKAADEAQDIQNGGAGGPAPAGGSSYGYGSFRFGSGTAGRRAQL